MTHWLDKEMGWILEIDLTYTCNLSCRHCNRLCNSENLYNIKRSKLDMEDKHIDYLVSQIRNYPKGKINLVRIIGGEPLLSPILNNTVCKMELLLKEDFLKELKIVTNGTIPISKEIKKYITLSPIELLYKLENKNGPLPKNYVYMIKNSKHRNITVVPNDLNQKSTLCNRVLTCGICYTIYGFLFTAPCTPAMLVFPDNHKRFLYHLPKTFRDFTLNNFESHVCNNCGFRLEKHQLNGDIDNIGTTWRVQIEKNSELLTEPNLNWIDN